MDVASGMSGLSAAVNLARSLRESLKSGEMKSDEIAGRIGEIYDYIVDSKDALVDAKDQIADLKDEIRRLKAATEDEQRFQFMHGVYWRTYEVCVHDEEHEAIHGTPKTELRW